MTYDEALNIIQYRQYELDSDMREAINTIILEHVALKSKCIHEITLIDKRLDGLEKIADRIITSKEATNG